MESCIFGVVQEKSQLVNQISDVQQSLIEMKSSLAQAVEDKKNCFQEKLELHKKLHNMTLARDCLIKVRKLSCSSVFTPSHGIREETAIISMTSFA